MKEIGGWKSYILLYLSTSSVETRSATKKGKKNHDKKIKSHKKFYTKGLSFWYRFSFVSKDFYLNTVIKIDPRFLEVEKWDNNFAKKEKKFSKIKEFFAKILGSEQVRPALVL